MKRLIACALLLPGLLGTPVLAEDVVRDRVTIPADGSSATLKGAVRGYGSHDYMVDARTGQLMTVKLAARNKSTYFNVFAPGKRPGQDQAIFIGSTSGDTFTGKLPETGDYLVQVYLYRNAARRDETSNYTITIDVKNETGGAEPGGDFADGLMGGPDFWEIKGITAGKAVNLRRTPSASATIVERLPAGTVLRNKGCKMNGEQRWCHVELRDTPSVAGWVAGQYLREAAVSGSGASPDDALVPGTNYHAVGRIPCTLDGQPAVKDCEFGVTRGAPGVATVFITLPNGFVRVLSFDGGKVVPQSAVTDFNSRRDQDNTLVKVNGSDESYTIPDAVIFGG